MTIIIGRSLFEEISGIDKDVEKLNIKRNKFIHNCRKCEQQDAKKCLETTLTILKFLNKNGANYDLPDKLYFWSHGESKEYSRLERDENDINIP